MHKNSHSLLFITLGIFFLVIISNNQAFAENKTATIPMGASNPNLDTPTKYWFDPPIISASVGDTITWTNKDNEIHNIVSGKGPGRYEAVNGHPGIPDGYFSSGTFKPGESWSFTFNKIGTFTYYCSIHPWMEGAVVVGQSIPDIAIDSAGNSITKWPEIRYTDDKKFESDLSWEPHVVLTGEKITFIYQFYDPKTSSVIPYTNYEFVITQNSTELFRTPGTTQLGGDYKYFVFKEPGPVEFKFEKIGDTNLSTEFSTIVYKNPNETMNTVVVQPARNIHLSQEVTFLYVLPPIGIVVFVVIWASKGKWQRNKTEQTEKRTPI